METRSQPTFWQQLSAVATAFVEWAQEHQDEIRGWALWGSVSTACVDARLYAPMHPEAWLEIDAAVHPDDGGQPDYEAIITSTYGPGGVGFDALRQELLLAPLLRDRQHEVEEILESLADGRNYVAVCGTVPLVEHVLTSVTGKWNHPHKRVKELEARLEADDIDADDDLLLDYAAVQMVREEIPNVWKSAPPKPGGVVGELNRQYVLHGTGRGWDDPANATRAVLLLAAVARVADPLFKPKAQATAAPS